MTSSTLGLLTQITLVGATLTTAMVAGLMFCFDRTVMPGLVTLDDGDHVKAFGRIDVPIPNPWMLVTCLASPVLTALGLALTLLDGDGRRALWMGVAMVLVVAAGAITAVVHLPLNAQVRGAAAGSTQTADSTNLAHLLLTRWRPWNVVRTVTSVAAVVALCLAVLSRRA